MNNENGLNGGGILSAFLLGALIGGGLALLYAPHDGKETRETLARRADELKEKTNQAVATAKDKIHEKKDEIMAAVDAGRRAVNEQRDKLAHAIANHDMDA